MSFRARLGNIVECRRTENLNFSILNHLYYYFFRRNTRVLDFIMTRHDVFLENIVVVKKKKTKKKRAKKGQKKKQTERYSEK